MLDVRLKLIEDLDRAIENRTRLEALYRISRSPLQAGATG